MKTSFTLVSSLVAVLVGGTFAACSSIDPVAPEIGVAPETTDDAGRDAAVDAGADSGSDAEIDACAAETDAELATASCTGGKNCGDLTVTDGCGASRTVSCGTCGTTDAGVPTACNTQTNTCECVPDSDADLVASECTAKNKNCGALTITDRCGATRTVACGACEGSATCGADNVCACSGGAYACGRGCVRNCLEGCATAPTSCEDKKRCVSACGGTTCAGRSATCTTFNATVGRADVCTDVVDGGACPSFSASCTTAANCGLSQPRAKAVCVSGQCFYCGAPGSDGLACGGTGTCNAATRSCQ